MNKKDFLSILANGLKDFPEKDVAQIIFDYQEQFTIGLNNGQTEEEIIEHIGNPHEIVYDYRLTYKEKIENNELFNDIPYEEIKESTVEKETNYSNTNEEMKNTTNSINNFINTIKNKIKNLFENFSINGNNLLKLIIGILLFIILAPFALLSLGVIGSIILAISIGIFSLSIANFSLSGGCIVLLLSKVGLSVMGLSPPPNFILDFPNSTVIFLILGSLSLGSLFLFLTYYFIKAIFLFISNTFKKISKRRA